MEIESLYKVGLGALCVFGLISALGSAQYLTGGSGQCDSRSLYMNGSCRLSTCPANETYLPGSSYCDVYSRYFLTSYVRCVGALPCCVWGGACRTSCNSNENRLALRTECNNFASGVCCVPFSTRNTGIGDTGTRNNSFQQSVARRQGQCGGNTVVAPRIIGGRIAQPTDWPWMVRLIYRTNVNGVCAGVLVDDDTVVTVAHCVSGTRSTNLQVQVGDYDLTRPDPNEELVNVRSIEVNSNYVGGRRGNDFAVLKLSTPIAFTSTKLPACLPDPEIKIFPNAQCFVAGWGVSENGQVSAQLRAAPVRLMNLTTCNAVLGAVSGNFEQIPSDMLCTDTAATRSDACLFDDGGMLVCRDANNRYSLLGLVSEYSCGSLPTVFTRVDNYTEAILTRL